MRAPQTQAGNEKRKTVTQQQQEKEHARFRKPVCRTQSADARCPQMSPGCAAKYCSRTASSLVHGDIPAEGFSRARAHVFSFETDKRRQSHAVQITHRHDDVRRNESAQRSGGGKRKSAMQKILQMLAASQAGRWGGSFFSRRFCASWRDARRKRETCDKRRCGTRNATCLRRAEPCRDTLYTRASNILRHLLRAL